MELKKIATTQRSHLLVQKNIDANINSYFLTIKILKEKLHNWISLLIPKRLRYYFSVVSENNQFSLIKATQYLLRYFEL